ncbi:MAG: hypothetical protein HZA46_16940, partial [Planctomycetales bacterium]|nr:hypothetical protein [Planctomycetales bacterium]
MQCVEQRQVATERSRHAPRDEPSWDSPSIGHSAHHAERDGYVMVNTPPSQTTPARNDLTRQPLITNLFRVLSRVSRGTLVLAIAWCQFAAAADPLPKSLDPRIKIELFAENPQLNTPTGIDVDHAGRVWVIESNTHFPPEGYTGHPTDRVLVMTDKDGDGQADDIVTFTDGLKFTMSVAVRPLWFPVSGKALAAGDSKKTAGDSANPPAASAAPLTSVYLATRHEIFLFHDDDGDLKADRKESIVRLETNGNYPHNGLAGIAFDPIGWMFFGFGENLGEPYKIIGSDGTTLSGGGEGGNVYRCRLDGSKLERWATGFWNPHASCFDAFGRLFTVDNDADSRPPCRLLHIIPGGDYGFRFRNGRKGLHPFTAWNGEIPGTLPMVAGTGEAPSGILAYESDGLPDEYLGNLLVTSWGDHRIDRFRLKPKGASFESLAEPLIVGGENFRPVGIACAPDGSLFVSDWVLRDYKLHGKGRVWKVTPAHAAKQKPTSSDDPDQASDKSKSLEKIGSPSLAIRRTAVDAIAKSESGRKQLSDVLMKPRFGDRARFEAFWGLKRNDYTSQKQKSDTSILRFAFRENDELLIAVLATLDDATKREIRSSKPPSEHSLFSSLPKGNDDDSWDSRHLFAFLTNGLASDEMAGLMGSAILLEADQHFGMAAAVSYLETVPWGEEYTQYRISDKGGRSGAMPLGFLLAARRRTPVDKATVAIALDSRQPFVRRASVQWVAEEGLKEFRPQVAAILNDPGITSDLFLATLAALEMLDGVPPQEFDKTPASKYVVPLLKDANRPAAVRASALRLVAADDPALDAKLLKQLLASEDFTLRLETLRTLQFSSLAEAGELLATVAQSPSPWDDVIKVGGYEKATLANNAHRLLNSE